MMIAATEVVRAHFPTFAVVFWTVGAGFGIAAWLTLLFGGK